MRADHDVVRRLLEGHRAERLEAARSIRVRFSSGGLAFAAKRQPDALLDAQAVLAPTRQCITVRGQRPRAWDVSIPDTDALRDRLASLHHGTRRLRWTPEDAGVFAAAAIWTYITMPLLVRDAAELRIRRERRGVEQLVVDLGDRIAGHARKQVLYVDPSGLIVRHDYTATAFGRWARAAQCVDDYRVADGVAIGTFRRVTPRAGRWRLPGPTLVWIQLHDLTLDKCDP